jgi:SAM-dependent methyltransferase
MWNVYDHVRLLSRWDRAVGLIKTVISCIKSNDIVLDAGCGSGLLSILAVKQGASKVIAVDSESIDFARELAVENGCGNKIIFIRDSLEDLQLSEYYGKFDVIAAMIYINDPRRDEHQSRIALELRKKYLKQGGRLFPDRVNYKAFACDYPEFDYINKKLNFDKRLEEFKGRYGVSFDVFKKYAENQIDKKFFPVRSQSNGEIGDSKDHCLLSGPANFIEIDYYRDDFQYPRCFNLEISCPGWLNSVVFVQELWSRDILIFSNESLSYIANPREVKKGEIVSVAIDNRWRNSNVAALVGN